MGACLGSCAGTQEYEVELRRAEKRATDAENEARQLQKRLQAAVEERDRLKTELERSRDEEPWSAAEPGKEDQGNDKDKERERARRKQLEKQMEELQALLHQRDEHYKDELNRIADGLKKHLEMASEWRSREEFQIHQPDTSP